MEDRLRKYYEERMILRFVVADQIDWKQTQPRCQSFHQGEAHSLQDEMYVFVSLHMLLTIEGRTT
jgi:hypothetical protein